MCQRMYQLNMEEVLSAEALTHSFDASLSLGFELTETFIQSIATSPIPWGFTSVL